MGYMVQRDHCGFVPIGNHQFLTNGDHSDMGVAWAEKRRPGGDQWPGLGREKHVGKEQGVPGEEKHWVNPKRRQGSVVQYLWEREHG